MGNQRFESGSGNGVGGHVRNAVLGVAGILAFSVAWGCFYTVDGAERVVILRNGAYQSTELPGWHFKLPVIDSVVRISMETTNTKWGTEKGTFEAYSADQQPAHLRVSVTLQAAADKTEIFYKDFRGDSKSAMDRLITPHVNNLFKATFGTYTAARAITQRTKLDHDAMEKLTEALGPDSIFIIKSVQYEDIQFSPAYMTSIEQRMQAEVAVEKERQNLEREKIEAQIKVTQAQGRADSTLAEAKAAALAIELRGNADGLAIKARGDALAQNPNLVSLVQAEKWNGQLPSTMVPGSALPMLTIPTAATTTAQLPSK